MLSSHASTNASAGLICVVGRPEHGAVEADGSLPVFECGLPSQAHKLLWADELLIELLGENSNY